MTGYYENNIGADIGFIATLLRALHDPRMPHQPLRAARSLQNSNIGHAGAADLGYDGCRLRRPRVCGISQSEAWSRGARVQVSECGAPRPCLTAASLPQGEERFVCSTRQQPRLAANRPDQRDGVAIEARENAAAGAPAFESDDAIGEISPSFENGETGLN